MWTIFLKYLNILVGIIIGFYFILYLKGSYQPNAYSVGLYMSITILYFFYSAYMYNDERIKKIKRVDDLNLAHGRMDAVNKLTGTYVRTVTDEESNDIIYCEKCGAKDQLDFTDYGYFTFVECTVCDHDFKINRKTYYV